MKKLGTEKNSFFSFNEYLTNATHFPLLSNELEIAVKVTQNILCVKESVTYLLFSFEFCKCVCARLRERLRYLYFLPR